MFAQELPKLTPAKVIRVIDGDTFEAQIGNKTEKIRLIGVNCPESTTTVEPFGTEASDFAKSILLNKEVFLEFDVEYLDKYERVLAYAWLTQPKEISEEEIRNKMFNAMVLLNGYAQTMTIPPNVKYVDYFVKFQKEAREKNKGLWGIEVVQEESKEELEHTNLASEEIKRIRKDLEERKELIRKTYTFSQNGALYSLASFVEPEGIIIILIGGFESVFSEENLDLFLDKLCDAFVSANYPLEIMLNVYVQIPEDYSLIVKVPIGAIYDYVKEKINKIDFLSKCIIYINGIKVDYKKVFAEKAPYVGNVKTKVFHNSSCRYVKEMDEENKVYFKTREEAIDSGYRPCKVCNP
ncbi:thermonuclease family protein [Fervidobacterium nodosum]|uniref:Nuclease (SNase domain protein) n=1 Tax=Fervidobacterium nodosum (strain ATCC 35602 / DSM 5306 / Rt17-B1) TaxID=381764 RepID=A7HJ46_FERNB|nr:nuclease (SNase domain protein) [Fervidobacterium nodosum Rt17-B1]